MKKKLWIFAFVALALFLSGFFSFFEQSRAPSDKGTDNAAYGTVKINGVSIGVELANTSEKQEQGLSGRNALGENEGMLFLFGKKDFYGFWMKDVPFPIDIVWIDGDKVIGIEPSVSPQDGDDVSNLKIYYPPAPADKALEINAGKAEEWGIREETVSRTGQ
ncbi:hypothetical protein A3I34_00580 [Candidatus Jorgensenbacteria bacterium RIFCSPLOWO2_02_FULL_45_12]|uniref:DUF192 domain-containing protein n=2 Tax=Candidatus Joergenseniibacteriota TaxID=1752739 RepID=A0A1F6BN26_9BACT|nr:MAG: hypothetical protein A3D55_00680 [Candidatus Jorgensenbacteria bacterium RIFCSPHIGHO2_02_FULL_45_20]OGG42550.1 MAG: hypothetical protein A3I34_00580 [Candidatus Jorgensenbacteria bacterium RIFCSPLOWO2_02_FULL_45_12]